MRTCRKLFFLAVATLLVGFLASCGLFKQAMNGTLTATAAPTPSPTPEATHEPAPSPGTPILERALDAVPFSLMDGRLFIQMPVGAQDIARQRMSTMGAEASSHAETRLVLDGNGQQLVVYAQESFYYTDKLENDIDRIVKLRYGDAFAYTTEPSKQTGDGLTVVVFSPEKIDTSVDAVLIRGAVVGLADGTYITLNVFVTPETAKDIELCRKQADNILDTLQPGPRKIDTSPREARLGQNSIVLQLDPGYEIVQEEGADFSVFYLMKFVKLGEPAPSIGIYIGFYPTMQYKTKGIDESQMTTIKDTILSKRVEWMTYKAYPGKDIYSAETAFYLNSNKLIMHIFIDAADEAEFAELKKMIDTMKIK